MKVSTGISSTLLVVAALGVTGCHPKAADKAAGAPGALSAARPDQAVIRPILDQVDLELNKPFVDLHNQVVASNTNGAVYDDQLVVHGETETVPVDWWLWNKGYLEIGGVDSANRAFFRLSRKGAAFAAGLAPLWLKADAANPPVVQCGASESITKATCNVTLSIAVHLTPTGGSELRGVVMPVETIQTVATYDPTTGWSIGDLKGGGELSLQESVRTTVFGSAQSIVEPRKKWVDTVGPLLAAAPHGIDPSSAPAADASAAATATPEAAQPEPAAPHTVVSYNAPQPHPAEAANGGPGFNCNSALGQVEQMVCRDPRLAALDRRMLVEYRNAMNASSDSAGLRQSQRDWLRARDASSPDERVLVGLYDARIVWLHRLAAGR